MHRYGTYLTKDSDIASNYKIKVPLKHILSVLRISELIEGDISCAMEVVESDSAMCFFFTKNRDFNFTVGVGSIQFENLDDKMLDQNQIAGVITNRLGAKPKKQTDEPMQGDEVKREPTVKKETQQINTSS